jgi:hypothetical protein
MNGIRNTNNFSSLLITLACFGTFSIVSLAISQYYFYNFIRKEIQKVTTLLSSYDFVTIRLQVEKITTEILTFIHNTQSFIKIKNITTSELIKHFMSMISKNSVNESSKK